MRTSQAGAWLSRTNREAAGRGVVSLISPGGAHALDEATVVRDFRREDIAQAVDLHNRVFGANPAFSPATLGDYFNEVLFDNPWRDEALPSLMSLDGGGRITGLLGVLPRPMEFRGRRLRAAVCTQLMVAPSHRGRLTAVRLIKAFFSGPQDLSMGDGANEEARRLIVGLGGTAALPYSMHWIRPLRPARYVLSMLRKQPALRPLAALAQPLGALADMAAARMRQNRFAEPSADLEDGPLESLTMLAHLPLMCQEASLRPIYDAHSLHWLLEQASTKSRYGKLRSRAVFTSRRGLIGWYLYYLQPGAISEVIQIAAIHGAFDGVLQQLFNDAWRHGAVALRGRLDPAHLQELSDRHCWFRRDGPWTLMHSRHPDVLDALHRGDAFLSRLDAEWWMRFHG